MRFKRWSRRPSLGTPRRAVVGWDTSRLAMLVAVLEAHAGIRLGQHDIYLTIAGGLAGSANRRRTWRLPPLSSRRCPAKPCRRVAVYFGEVGLSGAVRPVAHAPARLKEAAKLGFTSAVVPKAVSPKPVERAEASGPMAHIAAETCDHIGALAASIAAP